MFIFHGSKKPLFEIRLFFVWLERKTGVFSRVEAMIMRNWSGTYSCNASEIVYPKSVEEVRAILKDITRNTVKAVNGVPHSPNDLWCVDDVDGSSTTMVCMRDMNRILHVDAVKGLIVVEGGASIGQVADACESHGLILAALPTIKTMSVAGAISTGCHGSGVGYGSLSTRVECLTIVDASGELWSCSETQNRDMFRAALCSLGALGIIVEVQLKVEKRFAIAERFEWGCSWDLDLERVGRECDFVKLYIYPQVGRTLAVKGNALAQGGKADKEHYPWWKPVETWAFSVLYLLLSCAWANWLYYGWVYLMYRPVLLVEELSSPLLHLSQLTTEWAIPIEYANVLWRQLTQFLENNPELPAHWLEVRFVNGSSRELISPVSTDAGQNALFCYVGLVSFTPLGKRLAKSGQLFEAFEKLCRSAHGRPHWAKEHHMHATELADTFGAQRWEQFLRIRQQMDPKGKFLNAHLKRLLIF